MEFEKNGISDILKIKNKKNVLMLKYEEFFDNFDSIYSAIEQFFDTKISCRMREDITARYQVQNVERMVSSKNTFSEYDEITHWHGNHISKYKGKPYYYQEFFQSDQIEYLKNVYGEYLSEFDYS
jgi:Sulfotransferase domain